MAQRHDAVYAAEVPVLFFSSPAPFFTGRTTALISTTADGPPAGNFGSSASCRDAVPCSLGIYSRDAGRPRRCQAFGGILAVSG